MREKTNSFLKRLRPKRTDDKTAVNIEHISVIEHSCDAVGWRPVDYTVPEDFVAFHNDVETNVKAFISKAHPDMYNKDFYKEAAAMAVRKSLADLDKQSVQHLRSIHSIMIYQDASLTDLKVYLEQLEADLKEKEESDE